jgi:hypothetical protein
MVEGKVQSQEVGVQAEQEEQDERAVGQNHQKRRRKDSLAKSGTCTDRSLFGTHTKECKQRVLVVLTLNKDSRPLVQVVQEMEQAARYSVREAEEEVKDDSER